jgi:hypothetical protein
MKNFEKIIALLAEILAELKGKKNDLELPEKMTVDEVSLLLRQSVSSTYRDTKLKNGLPFYKKKKKGIYFLRSEITAWLKSK